MMPKTLPDLKKEMLKYQDRARPRDSQFTKVHFYTLYTAY
ncbi:MAG: hypothetical protein RLZZ04_1144 [Cyanobacteriota bacterium]|jgi:hypothetical protein